MTKIEERLKVVFNGQLPSDFSQAVRMLKRPYTAISEEVYRRLVKRLENAESDLFLLDGQKVTIGNADNGFAIMPLGDANQT